MEQVVELYYKPWEVFWVIQSIGLLLFVFGMAYKVSFYLKAQKKSLYREIDYFLILKAFFQEVLIQKQLAQKSLIRWLAHLSIFYGFMGLLSLSAIAVALETIIPEGSTLSQYMLHGPGHNYYKMAGDFFGLLILLGLCLAFIRRYIIKDSQLYTEQTDSVTLGFLFILVVTGFLLEAFRIALSAPAPELQYSFVGHALAGAFRGMNGIENLATGLWVFHAAITAVFLAYFPHSKFMHVINSPVEIVLNATEERMRGDLYL